MEIGEGVERTGKNGCDSLVDGCDLPDLQVVTGEESHYHEHQEDEDGPGRVNLLLGGIFACTEACQLLSSGNTERGSGERIRTIRICFVGCPP